MQQKTKEILRQAQKENEAFFKKVDQELYEKTKKSRFGCVNCLWAGCECKGGENFYFTSYNGVASCKRYTYYD